MAELLRNGSFLEDWGSEGSHKALVIPTPGQPGIMTIPNIFTPPGWLTWYRHDPDLWDQPEVRDAWREHDPTRVAEGNKAILLFTFYRRHDAGFLQSVRVTPGKRYRFSAQAHAWSNHDGPGFPHPDDPRWSEGVGYNVVSLYPDAIPELNGDPQNDAIGNFLFILGIDPTGNINPLEETVIWGTPVANYNAYFPVPGVEAVAQSDKLTVFLRSTTMWGFKHNDAYWDAAALIEIEEPEPEPPLRQYARTVHLLPQDATRDEVTQVVETAFPERQSVVWSVDDAFITHPALTERTVHVWDAKRVAGGEGELEAWVETYYPPLPEIAYHRFESEEPEEPQYPAPAEFLSLHIQARSDGDEEYIAAIRPEWVKLVFNMQWAREWIKPVTGGITKVLYRHCINNYDPYFNHPDGLRAGARLYLEQFLDSLVAEAEWIDAVECTNEKIATNDPDGTKRTVEFECHFADHLHAELGDAVAPCLLNPGVGNPGHDEVHLLLPAAQQAVRYGSYLGGHTYIGFRSADHYCTVPDEVRHFSMRPLLSWDVEFAKHGIYPQYIFTEGGAIYVAPNGSMPSASAGWLYKETCGGDWDWYRDKLLEYRRLVAGWNAQHGNRCRGQCLFTFGGGEEWEHFRISREQLADLAQHLKPV